MRPARGYDQWHGCRAGEDFGGNEDQIEEADCRKIVEKYQKSKELPSPLFHRQQTLKNQREDKARS